VEKEQLAARDQLLQLLQVWRQSDPQAWWIRYNRDSDTLFVLQASAKGRPGVSIPVSGSMYLRVSPDRQEPFGMQIEDFISVIAPAHPETLDLLDQADSPGLSNDEIMQYRRQFSHASPLVFEQLLAGVAD